MMAAARAGMVAVAITTGAASAQELREAGASIALRTLEPLQEDLRRRGLIG
jgi:phosphoglycolate phosphatase-like HAD superfamily hydrolase